MSVAAASSPSLFITIAGRASSLSAGGQSTLRKFSNTHTDRPHTADAAPRSGRKKSSLPKVGTCRCAAHAKCVQVFSASEVVDAPPLDDKHAQLLGTASKTSHISLA